jgi:gliding motility-associated-like protein
MTRFGIWCICRRYESVGLNAIYDEPRSGRPREITAPSITFTEDGSYLLVAAVGNCEVSRTVQVEYLETFKVPNVISVNADGINDHWVLPNSYSNKEEVRITIYNERGEEIFNQTRYQNNWPESTRAFPQQNMVFFYKIRKAEKVLKQGTITVIR